LDCEFLERNQWWITAILMATKRHSCRYTPGTRKIGLLKTLYRYRSECRVSEVFFYLRASEWPVLHQKYKASHQNRQERNRAQQQPIS
jgi:Zn-dependent peptidase ImmA (M78 family)